MITLEGICLRPETAIWLLNLVVMVSLASGIGLATTLLCRRAPAPARHGVLLAALGLALLSPVLVWLAAETRLGFLTVAASEPRNPGEPTLPTVGAATPPGRPEVDPAAASPMPVPPAARPSLDGGPTDAAEYPAGKSLVWKEPAPDGPANRSQAQADNSPATPRWWRIVATLCLGVWTLGVLARAMVLGRGWLSVVRLRRSFEASCDHGLKRMVRRAARALGLRQAPPVFASTSVTVPLSLGLLRPVLVLPKGIERETTHEAIQALLLHELAHIVRADRWVGLVQRIAALLYWWNPLIHRVNDCLSELREEICDDWVLRIQGDGRCFAELLVEIAARTGRAAQVPFGVGVLRPKLDGLHGRITRLLTKEKNVMTRMNLSATVAVVAFGMVLAGVLLISGVRAAVNPPGGEKPNAAATERAREGSGEKDAGSNAPQGPLGLVKLLHDRTEYFLGENILIHYCLENIGAEPLSYAKGGFYPALRRNDGYAISAVPVDPNGTPLESMPEPQNFGGPAGSWSLKPGEVYEQTLYLPRYLRLERPGRYLIEIVNHDRLNRKRRYSAGATTITLKRPSPEQARGVYERMKKLPREPVAGIGERRDQVIADFEAMVHPVYLPILLEHAREGDRDALPSIGKMRTVESTQALITLVDQGLAADDVELALAAYDRMGGRLPNPRFYRHGENIVMPEYYAPQRRFVERVWRPAFAEPLRKLAGRLARDPETNALGAISFIYECVGTGEDMPDLILAYTKSIKATETLPFETHQYFRPRGSAYGYRFSTRQLLNRDAKVPADPQTPGAMAVYLIAMQMRDDFRPADWPDHVTRWLKCKTPYMREFVLEHMPEPIPQSALQMLPELLADDYVDLQIAACHTAKRHPREAFRKPILAILQTESEQYLLNAAAGAAPANGVTNDRIMEVWLDRLENDDLGPQAVVRLLLTVLDDNQARTPQKLDPGAIEATKARWRRFIEEHREKLRQGHRFKLGDPEITPDLFPPGFQFYFDGKPWPAS